LKDEVVKPDLVGAIEYFKTVAGATDLPFWPYWLGGSLAASAPEFLAAMKDVPNFKGMK
jgi:dihydrodipicolinate synthase/N-acetylneuraminate lyase